MAKVFTVDTLELSKRLVKAGMKQETAEVLAEELKEIGEQSADELTTKKDLQLAKQDIIIKIGAMIAIAVAIIAWLDTIIKG